ncbi:stage III sporulation protein SpoIIIAB [Serpentinicella sp. ANB-PHB4]|uniref:stage III sporulation protein SpoIIIAB n=1 Tax=Serpentinicella sp. ANB-PHB4 TaxID=3074076 RepID=UPI002858DA34|nr:stage III sporulation protein SpoIIIAB [Serpentinicella sp. ANB-PHB4]MDR5658199.1 stage III sporulation protein SpoIIIAB [Serpentinicella sp. ANB-PHB4]
MMIKMILSILIVVGSTLIGIIYANAYIQRTKSLNNIIGTLQTLESEIVYCATPLPFLLRKISTRDNQDINRVFSKTVDILDKKDGSTFFNAWKEAIHIETKNTVLSADDIELLVQLGNNLGTSDIEDQVKHIRLAMEEIKRNYEAAILAQNNNVKLCKNLGFLFGVTIVILFF